MNSTIYKQELKNQCDVLIIGGGAAGIIAAVQSARMGAKTMLVEMSSQIGGTTTNCGVCCISGFFGEDKRVIGGIGWELFSRTRELGDPAFLDTKFMVDQKVYSMLAEEMCLDAGVNICYHEILSELKQVNDKWIAETTGNLLSRTITATEVIDCSGEAIAVRLAGGECERADICQPGTLEFNFSGFNVEDIDADLIEEKFSQAVEDGTLKREDYCYFDKPFIDYLRNGGGGNFQHLVGVYGDNSFTQTQANIEGRQRLLKMLRFLRGVPGLERCFLRKMDIQTGIREGWRIVGETTVTADDYLSGRFFPDAVAWTYFFIDIHCHDGVKKTHLAPGVFPVIPFGALIPKGMDHILAAGRIISSDHEAHSALRVQASCMAMGQAVGAAAALAVKHNIPSRNVDINELRLAIAQEGAIVPEQTVAEMAEA